MADYICMNEYNMECQDGDDQGPNKENNQSKYSGIDYKLPSDVELNTVHWMPNDVEPRDASRVI